MSIRIRALTSFIAIALALAAFSGAAQAAEKIRVGVPEGRAFMFAVVDVGNEAGIFKKVGLDVEKVDFQGGAKLWQGLASNSVDVAVAGSSDIKFILKGIPARAIAETAGPPVDLALIVGADGSVTRPEQLKGQRIGVTTPGSLTHWLALRFAQHEGWGEDGVQPVAVGGMQGEISALLTKQVAAIVGPTEIGLSLEHKGRAKILTDYGKVLPHWVTHLMYATTMAMKERPRAVKKFVAGWFDTVAYMRANKARTVKIVSAVMKVPATIASQAYDMEMPAITSQGRINAKAFQALEAAVLPPSLRIKATKGQLIDTAFLR